MSSDSVSGVVNAVIASVLDVEDGKVLPGARLREELGASEDDVWTLLLALEDELDISMEEALRGNLSESLLIVGDVIDYCEKAAQSRRRKGLAHAGRA